DSEKALPMLRKLLEGNQPPTIKEKALFVLSQSGSDKAREIVGNFARGKANPALQLKSLEYLALSGGKESRQVLADVYASTSEKKIKRAILHFFMSGADRGGVGEPLLRRDGQGAAQESNRSALPARQCESHRGNLSQGNRSGTEEKGRGTTLDHEFRGGLEAFPGNPGQVGGGHEDQALEP